LGERGEYAKGKWDDLGEIRGVLMGKKVVNFGLRETKKKKWPSTNQKGKRSLGKDASQPRILKVCQSLLGTGSKRKKRELGPGVHGRIRDQKTWP